MAEMAVTARPAGYETQSNDPMESLCRLLLERELADERMLERARVVAAETGRRLDVVLTQLGIVSDRALAHLGAELLGISMAGPDRYPAEPILAERLKPNFLRRSRAIPISDDGAILVMAVADPFDQFLPLAVADAAERTIKLEVAVPAELEAALDRLYPEGRSGGSGGDADGDYQPFEDDAERLKDLASEAPVIRLVNQIIARAVENGASDIHIQPLPDRVRVRFRYDGVLHEEEAQPARLAAAIVSRVKIMSSLDVAERRLPQDGRLKLPVRGQEVDFRVSTVPSIHGETVVLRVLDRTSVSFEFAKLGLPEGITRRLRGLLDLPNGMILVTGPTGSGKTTTLYAGLSGIDSVSRNVITVEDPVEFQLQGINQIQVKPQIGLTFASLLRSILRQDPDVIMIGEVRDLETAQIAVQASLTGHLVLSTLHTNTAAATITRLRDMGLEPYLITSVLKGVLAQRLLRRLCPSCARQEPASPELLERLALDSAGAPAFYHPVGCAACRHTGYRGRVAVAELLVPNDAVARLIFHGAAHDEIEAAAVRDGMVTMFRAGLDAALNGVTAVEEVIRTLSSDI